ncbi:gluconokinase [Nocardia niigatensis]|uniref:gluconokinase n=1 Tax=Nocardia niigatensis TaxID=209249 RepID=UPI0002FB17FA|nr:gluconokinase [Nocardia niigatensis]
MAIPERPQIVVLMGVSGSGKSTVAGMLVSSLGWDLLEGDDLHPPANIAKMAAGHALTDADRESWLAAIAAWMSEEYTAGRSAIVTCSALKRSYRDVLRRSLAGRPGAVLTFLHLTGSREELQRRLTARMDHFMPPDLLDSQLGTLEPPGPDEHIVSIEIGPPPHEVAGAALAAIRAHS